MKRFSRRSFLGALSALSLPAWFPRIALALPAEAVSAAGDILVCIFLRGGADGLNIVVPFGEDAYYDSRPELAIAQPKGNDPDSAIDLDGFFGFHPALAPLKELYDDGALALIHAAGSHDDTHSHFDAMDYMERGTPGNKNTPDGWIGRHLASMASDNDSPFRAIAIGQIIPTSLRGTVPATALSSIADFHLKGREDFVEDIQQSLGEIYAGGEWLDLEAQQTLRAIDTLAAINPGEYKPQNGATYPESEFGAALQQVAQLIRAEIGLEVACVDSGGWDTHEGQGSAEGAMPNLLEGLAAGLHAFHIDMGDKMDGITVAVMSEFGRRVRENASAGTDHGHGNCMLALGGGIAGGAVHGTWPGLESGQLYGPGDLAITTDFRTVLAEIVERRLLNSSISKVFPGFKAPDYLGFCS